MTKVSEVSSSSIDETTGKDYIKKFSKRMLKTHLFVGSFQEKRFVEHLNSYRDVIKIDSDEKDFIENLIAVKRKIKEEYAKYPSKNPIWIGITDSNTIGAPVGYNLWVVLPLEIFGNYWFKVKTVEFLENEVRVKLDVVRSFKHERSTSNASESEDNQSLDLKTTMHDMPKNFKNNLIFFWKEYITVRNIKSTVIFISLLIGTIIAGGANVIKYLLEYLLKFMRETSGVIKACTPIVISCINLVGKTVYGLFALIVTLWHGKPVKDPPVYNSYYSVNPNMLEFRDPRQRYNKYFNNRALPYPSSVEITPLDD